MPKAQKKVIKPGVDITAEKDSQLKSKLSKVLGKASGKLIIDCEKVKALDPVGLSVIIAAYNSLNDKGVKLNMINIRNDIYNQLKALGVDQTIELQAAE